MGKQLKNAMLGASIFYIVQGIIMIVWPDAACLVACYIMGAVGILYGLAEVVNYIRTRDYAQPEGGLIAGVFSVLIGLLFLIKTEVIVTVLIAALGVFVVADSVIKVIYAMQLKNAGVKPWKVYLIAACVLLALGVFMLIDPFKSVKFMIISAGVFLILDGLFNLWMILQVKNHINA